MAINVAVTHDLMSDNGYGIIYQVVCSLFMQFKKYNRYFSISMLLGISLSEQILFLVLIHAFYKNKRNTKK